MISSGSGLRTMLSWMKGLHDVLSGVAGSSGCNFEVQRSAPSPKGPWDTILRYTSSNSSMTGLCCEHG